MGSKGVKVIVVDPQGVTFRQPKDPENSKKQTCDSPRAQEHPVTGEALPSMAPTSSQTS